MTETEIGPGMVRVMCDTLRGMGYEVLSRSQLEPLVEVTVTNLERISADEYRADVEAHIRGVGRVTITRVYAQLVTSDGATRWSLKWPRRHKEGSAFGWSQEWVITAAMSGRLAASALDAIVDAIERMAATIVASGPTPSVR